MNRKITGLSSKIQRWVRKPKKPQLPKTVYPDDVFLVSYPRSGSAWLRRLIATTLNPQCSYEVHKTLNAVIPDMYVVGSRLSQYPRPRLIKSHEPYQPLYPKVIYLYRDGRDVAVSYYDFYRTVKQYGGTLDDFLRLFLQGKVHFGSWDAHCRSWILRAPAGPFLALAYEELHRNASQAVARVMEFLGNSSSEQAIQKAVEECTFNRRQEYVKNFSRHASTGYRGGVRGKPGAWRESLSHQQAATLWNAMADTLKHLGYQQ